MQLRGVDEEVGLTQRLLAEDIIGPPFIRLKGWDRSV